jgi:inhibitor of cysteine peptidase
MKTSAAIVGAVATLAVFAGACSAALGAPEQATVKVEYDEFSQEQHISKQATVSEGAKLIVELPSNPSTGFGWSAAAIANEATVSENGNEYVAPDGQALGAAGKQVWTFTANAKGTTKVSMEYGRPWEGGEKAEWTFEIIVTVQ